MMAVEMPGVDRAYPTRGRLGNAGLPTVSTTSSGALDHFGSLVYIAPSAKTFMAMIPRFFAAATGIALY